MSLDITFTSCRNVICPHCNEIVKTEPVNCEYSGGRCWYSILESIGYYVPYDERTDENDWYGKDMTLTTEHTKQVYDFIKENSNTIYKADSILNLILTAMIEEYAVVINADW